MLIIKYKDGDIRGVRCDDFTITKYSLLFSVVNEWDRDEMDAYNSEKWYSFTEDTEIPLHAVAEIMIDGQVVYSYDAANQ